MTDSSTTGSGGQTFSPGMVSGTYQKAKDNGLIIFFIALGIYALDYFFTKFNTLDAGFFFTTTGLKISQDILLKGIIGFSIFWIVFAVFYFIKKPENGRELISFFVLLSIIFFIIELVGIIGYKQGFNLDYAKLGVLVHLLFIFYGIRNGLLMNSRDKSEANVITILIILVDMFLFSLIYTFLHIDKTFLNQVIVPVLPIAALIYMGESKARNWILLGVSIFYIIILLQSYSLSAAIKTDTISDAQKEGTKNLVSSKFTQLWNGIKNWKNQTDMAISGDYYSGQVEQGQTEKLGVFIEDLKAADQNFIVNDSVEVWAKLKAYKLKGMNETIKINVICYATNGQKTIIGEINPKKTFEVDSYEEEFLTCKFPKGNKLSTEPGYYTVHFNATFNFNTQSYLKTYYMEKERKRVFVSQDINILSRYGITDSNPMAIFTNGPVKIGMETTSSLPTGVPIDKPDEFSSYIGITLDNNWKGTIKNITTLYITLPEGLSFNDECSSFNSIKSSDPKRKLYVFSKEQIEKDQKSGLKLPKSYKCALKLDNAQSLLGNTPLSIKTFYVTTSYIYQISESTGVSVKNG